MSWRKRAQEQVTHISLFHIEVTDKHKQERQCTYTHNIVGCKHNNNNICCCETAVRITHSECVSVTLVI